MADAKYSMPDGSYPISTCADVSDAAKLAHNSKTYSFAQIKEHVLRAKNALGCSDEVLPETWETKDAPGDSEKSATSEGDFIRAVPFELVPHSDGLTLEGYATVFNSTIHVKDWAGEYDETIQPGAFARSLRERMPVLMFEHGQHPLIGNLPLGALSEAYEDSKGVYVRGRISDNWLMVPVRDAIRDRAITGMSVRFNTPKSGEAWSSRGSSRSRIVTDGNLKELGPVVFPAYQLTTASVRSALDQLTGQPGGESGSGGSVGQQDDAAARLQAAQIRDRIWRMRKQRIG